MYSLSFSCKLPQGFGVLVLVGGYGELNPSMELHHEIQFRKNQYMRRPVNLMVYITYYMKFGPCFVYLCVDDHMTWLTLIGQLSEVKLPIMCLITFCKFCRQKQSSKQILALTILISAAVLLSVGESSSKGSKGGSSDYVLLYGIIPVTVASMLSGLASSLCQWASQVELTYYIYFPGYNLWSLLTHSIIVQVKKHTSYMMTIEMSFIGSMCMLASTYRSPDGEAIRKYGFFHEWTLWTVVSTL